MQKLAERTELKSYAKSGQPDSLRMRWDIPPEILFAALLVCSIVTWMAAIRAPLWLDETVSYWQISGGFSKIWSRQEVMFPTYSYILWAAKTILGSSEIALRVPSLLAMCMAVWVLYRISMEFFDSSISLAVTILFCVHPSILFAAIDARPYAFELLVLNSAILFLLRWIRLHDLRYALMAGAASAGIFYFHYLFAVILPAFLLVLLWCCGHELFQYRKHIAYALLAFALFLAPVFPQFVRVFHDRTTHVFSPPPTILSLVETFAPGATLLFFFLAVLFATVTKKFDNQNAEGPIAPVACLLLGVLPLAILYLVSTYTSTHVFIDRYCLVAAPGIALCWGLLLSRINSRVCQFVFCFALVAWSARVQFDAPTHGHSWKQAVEAANAANANVSAPVLVCSDLVEADYRPIPSDISSTWLYAPLSYYPLHSTVIPLPRSMNPAAEKQINTFLSRAIVGHQRFLIMGYRASSSILDWVDRSTTGSYERKPLGIYDGVAVVEYLPR